MVVNFEIVPGEYEDLPDVLLAIPGFKESPEFHAETYTDPAYREQVGKYYGGTYGL